GSRYWPPSRSPTILCRAQAALSRRSATPPHSWGRAGEAGRGARAQSSVQLDDRGDEPVTHLLVDVEDRGVVGVVVRAHPLEPSLDRLSHRLVLQRTGDATAADGSRRARVDSPWHTPNDWIVEY